MKAFVDTFSAVEAMETDHYAEGDHDLFEIAELLARQSGYISLSSPDRTTRRWFLRMAVAVRAERVRCADIARSNAHGDCQVAEQIAAMIEGAPLRANQL